MTFFFITLVYLFIWIQYLPVIAAFCFYISHDFKSVFMTYLLNMNSLNGPKMCPGAGEALTPPWSVASDLTDDLTTDVAWRKHDGSPDLGFGLRVLTMLLLWWVGVSLWACPHLWAHLGSTKSRLSPGATFSVDCNISRCVRISRFISLLRLTKVR